MKIWLINHYAVPPQYYPLARPSLFAQNLQAMGHQVTIIAAGTVHNTDCVNLIENKERVLKMTDNGLDYVLINCTPYRGNGIDRVRNIAEFANRLPKVLDRLEKPDAIVATSFDPLSCYAGIRYAKKHGIKAVAEIADLWPETLVAYNGVSPKNPLVRYLRGIEKKIYTRADRIVFTMEGAYDYIAEQGWEREIPREKVAYINNGVDLEQFDFNKETYRVEDAELSDPARFKVVYVGSIRKVNGLDSLLDAAKKVDDKRIVFLVWGDGDEKERLMRRVADEKIDNVIFKGKVDKKYVPYITSQADLNFAHNHSSELFRFGVSFNKIFDYLAAGKPILCDFDAAHNPVIEQQAGIEVKDPTDEAVAQTICQIAENPAAYEPMGRNARAAAEDIYNFKILSKKLAGLIEQI